MSYIESRECIKILRYLDNWGDSIRQSDLTGNHELAPIIPLEIKKRSPCFYTFFLSIMVDGHVRACGCRYTNGTQNDGLIIGHLDADTLADMWTGTKIKRLREDFLKGSLETVCDTCVQYSPYTAKERGLKRIVEYQSVRHQQH